jgi:iron(III) transport system permease protein
MDGALLRSAFRSPRPTVAVLLVILALAVIPPFIFLVYSSFHTFNPDGSFGSATLANFIQLFTDPRFFRSLWRSAAYAFGASLLAIVIGALQAWLAERTDAPLRQFLYVSAIVSLGIPYVLYIVAWLLFLGKAGPVNQALGALFGAGHYVDVNSLGGMIFVEGMMWSPLAFLLLSSVFRNADASYEEAATMCGAGLLSQLRHITLGMARPALLALAILVFIRASESFEVPALVGLPGSVQVLTTDIYQRLHLDVPPNVGSAAAFGCFILILMVVLLQLYSRVSAQAHRYRTVTGKGFRPRIMRLGPWRPLAGALVVGVPFIVILVPLLTVFWAALLPYYQSFSIAALQRVTMANFSQALNSSSFQDTILNSLILAAVTATIVTSLAAIMGWCVARRVPGGRLIDTMASVPLVFPAIVLGFAFLEIFLNLLPRYYGTLPSLIIACSVAFLPYGLRYTQLGVIQIHPELEEAASMGGAGQGSIFFRIILPLLVPALVSCWLFVFLLAARAMSLVLLLSGPEAHVMAVTLFDLWNNGQINEFAALGCLWMLIMTFFSIAFYFVARRYQLAVG